MWEGFLGFDWRSSIYCELKMKNRVSMCNCYVWSKSRSTVIGAENIQYLIRRRSFFLSMKPQIPAKPCGQADGIHE